jgi:hypothetical protein
VCVCVPISQISIIANPTTIIVVVLRLACCSMPLREGCHGITWRAEWRKSVRKVAFMWALALALDIDSAVSHWNMRTTGQFDSSGTCQLNDICPRQCRVLGLQLRDVVDCFAETGVGSMCKLLLEANASIGSSTSGPLSNKPIVRSRVMPCY